MKNVKRILGIISLMLVITLTFAACGNGTTNPPSADTPPAAKEPGKTVYRSEDGEGNVYRLEVSESVAGRAAYKPQKGDTYVLTIIYKDTTKGSQTSSGTVEAAGSTLTLKPTVATATFTITISTDSGGGGITAISGTITFDPEEGKAAETKVITTPIVLEIKPLTETDKMDIWLAEQPANTPATAYSYNLKIDNNVTWETLVVLNKHSNKYVKLDLSGSTITGIGFWGCKTLVSITLPNTVTSIWGWSFEDLTNLTSVNIPNSVTVIEDGAFASCTSLTSITIPNSVTSIGDWAFSGSGLTGSLTIPNSVTSIGEGAFMDCKSLTSVTLPNSITEIKGGTFGGSGLTSVTIPDSVTTIGTWAFGNANIKTLVIGSGVKYIAKWAFGLVNNASVTFKSADIEFEPDEWSFSGGLNEYYDGPGTYTGTLIVDGDDEWWEWTKQS